ncbi:MAG TPA: GlsB/YeaQ/YmgE family stress response membrane protein [Gemmata sp.]
MLSLLSWIVTGLIVGLIARALVPGRQSLGLLLTIVLGVIGAAVGGLISSAIWPTWQNNPNVDQMWPGWIMSVIGGVIVLWGYVALTRERARA